MPQSSGGASDVQLVGSSAVATATTSTSIVDLVTVTGLSIAATKSIRITFNWRKTATNATAVGFGLKLNATTVITAVASGNGAAESTTTQQAEDGYTIIEIGPRRTNYLTGIVVMGGARVSGTGANGAAVQFRGSTMAAVLPTATITDVILTAINTTSNNNAEITDVKVITY